MATRHDKAVIPPSDFVLVAAGEPGGTIALPDNCRGLLIGTAGALNVTMQNGSARDSVPMAAGVNPGQFAAVRATVGGAQNIWAIV